MHSYRLYQAQNRAIKSDKIVESNSRRELIEQEKLEKNEYTLVKWDDFR